MMSISTEMYVPLDGLGVINLNGSETECLLTVKGEPVQFCWFAEVGTVWRYLLGRSITRQLTTDNYAYQRLTELGELYPNNPLSVQFKHILHLLKYAEYELSITQFPHGHHIPPPSDSAVMGAYDDYGGLFDITFTQARIDPARVAYYRTLIRSGKRPIAVLLSLKQSFQTYVLDGHHKLVAYAQEKVDPVALRIVKVKGKEIDTQAGLQLIRTMIGPHPTYESIYLKEKKNQGYQRNFYSWYKKGDVASPYFKAYSIYP